MQIDLLISKIVLAGSIKVTFVDLDDGPHNNVFYIKRQDQIN